MVWVRVGEARGAAVGRGAPVMVRALALALALATAAHFRGRGRPAADFGIRIFRTGCVERAG